MSRTGTIAMLALLVPAVWPATGVAQFRDEGRIRRSTRSILDSSEFRHLRGRLREIPGPRDPGEGGDGAGGDSGNGGRGSGRGDGAGGGDARDGRDQGGAGRPDRRVSRGTREGQRSSDGWSGSGGGLSGGSGVASVMHLLAWVLVAGVCGLILYYVLRALMDANLSRDQPLEGEEFSPHAEGETEPVSAPGDLAADVYVRRARQLAAAGQLKEAVAHLLLGAMSHVEQRGLIRFRRGLTFRSYMAALSGSKTAREAFRALVRVYEPIEYGRREATRAHFEAALATYEEGFAT